MTIEELITKLKEYPSDTPIRLVVDNSVSTYEIKSVTDYKVKGNRFIKIQIV